MGLERLEVPEYARIERATVSMADMGAMQIEAEMRIDRDVKPNFSEDWVLGCMGARYIHTSRAPEAEKGVDSLEPTVRLQFVHEAVLELRRYWFVDVVTLVSGDVVADKFVVPISLTLGGFADLLGKVLTHYFGDRISCTLTDAARERASAEPVTIEISYTYIWDLLQKIYEYYGERWSIIKGEKEGSYVIEIGGDAPEINHIFEYGFEGGLMTVRRSPQSAEIKNKLWGRGGGKNLPYRYFKDVDPQNPTFRADPDWIPELRNAYFDRLRGATFRSYVQGWKTNQNRQLTEDGKPSGTPIKPYGSTVAISVETYDDGRGAVDEPYRRGHTDKVFDPIEYVKDDESISKYGELWGGVEDNDEIYPTIQGMQAAWGPANTAFEVEQVKSDDHTERVESDAKLLDLKMAQGTSAGKVKAQETVDVVIRVPGIRVEAGKTGVFSLGSYDISVHSEHSPTGSIVPSYAEKNALKEIRDAMEPGVETVRAFRSGRRMEEVSAVNMPGGDSGASYDVEVRMPIRYNLEKDPALFRDGVYVTVTLNSPKVTTSAPQDKWGETFDVWLGDIWGTPRKEGENDEQYTDRVWGPILGDKSGGEATVIFVTGALAVSEDYEFKIVDVNYDHNVSYAVGGEPYQSAWRLTLAKSDADLETLGVYVPSVMRQGKAGDRIAFVNVELPHAYVTDAEKRLDQYKEGKLEDVSEIRPSWEVDVDSVRMHQMLGGETEALVTQLRAGSRISLADKRFIQGAPEILYLQSVTFEYGQDSMLPKISMVLSNEVMAVTNPVGTIQGEVSEIHRQLGSIGNVERTVRAVGDKLYLRKDGMTDRSVSPTQFDALVSSSDFRQGFVGGKGYGFYRDGNGRAVIEADRMVVRESMHVNSFVVNEVTALGGKMVWTAASMRVTAVESVVINDTESGWRCYFDRKGGSVNNHFRAGDVAFCERFDPADPNFKTYKMYKSRVYDAGPDYIDLYADGPFRYGDGVPAEDDAIAQFGSYTDADRRYAIVIDVIGGGYVRFLSGLDSVTAQGTEYGFFGRQTSSGEKMFIGSETGFVKYEGGKLTVLGDFTVKLPDGNTTPLTAYINSLISDADTELIEKMQGMLQSGRNLVLNTNRGAQGFSVNSGLSAFSLSSEPMGAYGAEAAVLTREADKNPQYQFEAILVDFRPQLVSRGHTYNISFDYAIENKGPYAQIFQIQPSFSRLDGSGTLLYFEPKALLSDGATHHFESVSNGAATSSGTESSGQKLYFDFKQGRGAWSKMRIWNLRVGEGTEQVPWSAAPEDVDLRFGYLMKAFENDTTISGGLIQSSLVRLGYRDSGGKFVPTAGVNGIADTSKPGQGIALWAGGDIIDKEENPSAGARAAIRMDGTAYFCGNTVRLNESEMGIGDSLTANANGLFMVAEGGVPLSVQNKPIGISVNSIAQMYKPFNFPNEGTIGYIWKRLSTGEKVFNPMWAASAGTVTCAPGETLTGTLVGTVSGGNITNNEYAKNLPLYVVVVKEGGERVYSSQMSLWQYTGNEVTKKGDITNITNDSDQSVKYTIFFSGNADAEDVFVGNAPADPDAPGGLTPAYTYVSGGWKTEATGNHSVVTPNQTRLGSDGFGAIWGSSAFFIKDGDMLMRTGDHGLRISTDGIYYMGDGINWHRIDLGQIKAEA